MPNTTDHFDITIAGAGPVGTVTAFALAQLGYRVAIIEPTLRAKAFDVNEDTRAIALTYGSRRLLNALGLWESLTPLVHPLQYVHVSDRGHFGMTRLSAKEQGTDALGYMIQAPRLLQTFCEAVETETNVTWITPAAVEKADYQDKQWTIHLKTELETSVIHASLLIAADGAQSKLRNKMGIEVKTKDYQQTAVIANITTEQLPSKNTDELNVTAFERFTEQGPIALLPLGSQRYTVVWVSDPNEAKQHLNCSDEDFCHKLQSAFGYRVGTIKTVNRRIAYPLHLLVAQKQVAPGFLLLGNAVHTLHPNAAQGFNLCLQDIAELLTTIQGRDPKTLGDIEWLEHYESIVSPRQYQYIQSTDGLDTIFSNQKFPLVLGRNMGLLAMNILPPLRRFFIRRSMGLLKGLSPLARGNRLS